VKTNHFLRAAIIVTSLTLSSRVLGLIREAMIAGYFGANTNTDAFFVAFRVPDVLFNSLMSFLVATSFIPVFSERRANAGVNEASVLSGVVFNWMLVILIPVSCLLAIFAPQLVRWLAPGLHSETIARAVLMTRLMAPIIVFGGISGLGKSILNSLNHFVVPAMAPIAFNIAIILTIVSFSHRWGVTTLAIGVLAGAALQSLWIFPQLNSAGIRYTLRFDGDREGVRRVATLCGPVVLALLIGQIMPFVEIYLASRLPEGAISYLGYANRIYVLPEQLFTIVISTVLFPAMASDIASQNLDALKNKLSRAFNLTVFIILPVSCLMVALSQPILSVTLRRGAFGQADADHAASVLAAYSIALLAVCVRSLVTFGFFALQKPQVLLRWTAFMVPVNVLLDLILIPHFSYVGVALGCSITTVLHASILSVLLRRELKMSLIRHHGIVVLKVAACCGLMLLVVLFLQRSFDGLDLGASTIRQIFTLVVMVAATSSIYMLSARALQVSDATLVWEKVRHLISIPGLQEFFSAKLPAGE
jgi:putative peptidoglycan lipid II flippase